MTIRSQLIDLHIAEHYPVELTIENGIIQKIERFEKPWPNTTHILPGFVDASAA